MQFEQQEKVCSNVRDILNKYKGGNTQTQPSSWLDEIEDKEHTIQAHKNLKTTFSNNDTANDFSDIELIRKKYMNIF